jgi:hypothetical protein
MTRIWFQIHLSTAIVLMLAAAVLSWLNIHPEESVKVSEQGERLEIVDHGWPFNFSRKVYFRAAASEGGFLFVPHPYIDYVDDMPFPGFKTEMLFLNVFLAVFILLLIAFACEFRIRRREARKP